MGVEKGGCCWGRGGGQKRGLSHTAEPGGLGVAGPELCFQKGRRHNPPSQPTREFTSKSAGSNPCARGRSWASPKPFPLLSVESSIHRHPFIHRHTELQGASRVTWPHPLHNTGDSQLPPPRDPCSTPREGQQTSRIPGGKLPPGPERRLSLPWAYSTVHVLRHPGLSPSQGKRLRPGEEGGQGIPASTTIDGRLTQPWHCSGGCVRPLSRPAPWDWHRSRCSREGGCLHTAALQLTSGLSAGETGSRDPQEYPYLFYFSYF